MLICVKQCGYGYLRACHYAKKVVTLQPNSRNMKQKLTIVKVGGAVVEDETQLARLLADFTAIPGLKVLVHGGGRRATAVAAQLGIETRMVEGRRITDEDMLRVVTMVYGGLVNKTVVARLQALGANAIGLTGADAGIILSDRRPPVVVGEASKRCSNPDVADNASKRCIDFGFVGDVRRVDATMLSRLIDAGLTPVIAPLTHDGQGHILNTNADTMASETAKALSELYDVTLVFAFEKAGVLRDANDDTSVIPVIDRRAFEAFRADGTISGGMLPKVENALKAVDAGVTRVVITSATAIDGEHGTVIIKTTN